MNRARTTALTSQDQSEIIEFLSAASTYGLGAGQVECITTHGAMVFLAGERAYKLKRAVEFPYLDFSTLGKREQACRHEIDRNKPAAPEIYIGVQAVTRAHDGHLRLDGTGVPVDWLVVMNRFDQDKLFDRLAERSELSVTLMSELAGIIADSHETARTCPSIDGTHILGRIVTQVGASLFDATPLIDLEQTQLYRSQLATEFNKHSDLLRARSQDGFVRLCHGDLHLSNIVLHNGVPTLFDAIEFDDKIATIDVLYDLAFVLMDLWHRDCKAHANLCYSTYVGKAVETNQMKGLAALPLFLSVRAAIRAMVTIDKLKVTRAEDRHGDGMEAEAYLSLACRFLQPGKLSLIAIGGLSGTGKTTVSAALAPEIGRAPGALHLRSDVERKRMAGVDPSTRLPQSAYSKSTSDKVYRRLCDRAEQALKAGQSVVVDAVFLETVHRRDIEHVAARVGVPFCGIWLEAPQHQLLERVMARQGDASDADASVVNAQLALKAQAGAWEIVDASGPREAAVSRVQLIARARHLFA